MSGRTFVGHLETRRLHAVNSHVGQRYNSDANVRWHEDYGTRKCSTQNYPRRQYYVSQRITPNTLIKYSNTRLFFRSTQQRLPRGNNTHTQSHRHAASFSTANHIQALSRPGQVDSNADTTNLLCGEVLASLLWSRHVYATENGHTRNLCVSTSNQTEV